jgi:anti-sigma B factor antagonist
MINGVPVVAAPAEINLTTAERLRTVLLHSAGHGHATIVVDMARTQFCDSAGLSVLVRAHERAVTEGGELRVVIPAGSPVFQVFTVIGLHRLIPWFSSLDQAISVLPPRPRAGRARVP